MPKGGKGYFLHTESYDGPDQPFAKGMEEMHTLTCCHCNRVVILNPHRVRERHWCFKCDHYVCDAQYCIESCNPFQQTIELGLSHPDALVSAVRGPNGELLGDEPLLAEISKPHLGVSLPSGKEGNHGSALLG